LDNSEALIDEQLAHVKIARNVYKERLKDYKAKCTKRMETECLSMLELQLKSRVQCKTPKITGLQEYKSACEESVKAYFDSEGVVARVNMEFVHKGWTMNFSDKAGPNQMPDIAQVTERIKTLAGQLFRVNNNEQLLRIIKQFYINNSKKLYQSLLDFILANSIPSQAEIKVKKEVFKHLEDFGGGDTQHVYNSFLLLALLLTQILLSLCAVEDLVKQAAAEAHERDHHSLQRQDDNHNNHGGIGMLTLNDKKMIDRKHDQIAKKIASEF